MYRRTKKYSAARHESVQRGRDQARMDAPAPDYPTDLPQVRMRIIVERYDLATPERHEFELQRSGGRPTLEAGRTHRCAGWTAKSMPARHVNAQDLAPQANHPTTSSARAAA